MSFFPTEGCENSLSLKGRYFQRDCFSHSQKFLHLPCYLALYNSDRFARWPWSFTNVHGLIVLCLIQLLQMGFLDFWVIVITIIHFTNYNIPNSVCQEGVLHTWHSVQNIGDLSCISGLWKFLRGVKLASPLCDLVPYSTHVLKPNKTRKGQRSHKCYINFTLLRNFHSNVTILLPCHNERLKR